MPDSKEEVAKWHAEQVRIFAAERPHYVTFANTLKDVLAAAAARYAPEGIVQARPKDLASFAEKAVRKRQKYDRPAYQLTDLCGARIVTLTGGQKETLCRFIRDNFMVDDANSDDAAARLKPTEFGYRSVHFIVQVQAEDILGVKIPKTEIGIRKAEIQVRTLLEHSWASVTHDRIYKSNFKTPAYLERISSRLAALLENSERVVEEFELGIQEYLGNYAAHMSRDDLAYEMDIQTLVLTELQRVRDDSTPPTDPPAPPPDPSKQVPVALKLSQLARAAQQLEFAREKLMDVKDHVSPAQEVRFNLQLGITLLELSKHDPKSPHYAQGMNLLREVANPPTKVKPLRLSCDREEEKLRSEAAALLAEAAARTVLEEDKPADYYNLAMQRDPTDPYHLVSLFQFQPALDGGRLLESVRPAFLQALETCRRHVSAGLELPRAWLTQGRLHLLLGEPYQALEAYAKAIYFYRRAGAWKQDDYEAELGFLRAMRRAHFRGQIGWIEKLLQIGWAVVDDIQKQTPKLKTSTLATDTRRGHLHKFPSDGRVLIGAGGSDVRLAEGLAKYKDFIDAALCDFNGTVVSGGTTSGVPGLVGSVCNRLRQEGQPGFTLVGYHPAIMPAGVKLDSDNYQPLCEVPKLGDEEVGDFSAAEPLQNWIDLLASGVDPTQIRVLGINGGPISRFEYAVALALGATVGVIESSGREASAISRDSDWTSSGKLLPLPLDQATLHAFVHLPFDLGDWNKNELELMARKAHEIYLRSNPPNRKQPATFPWEYLPEDFIFSNQMQAVYAPQILRQVGYSAQKFSAQKATSPAEPAAGWNANVEKMAEFEHGRWNVERLLRGWRYAPIKNEELRHSPHLIPWEQVPENIRKYDREAIVHYSEILAAGGYEIIKGATR